MIRGARWAGQAPRHGFGDMAVAGWQRSPTGDIEAVSVRGKVAVGLSVAVLSWVGQASAAGPPWTARYTVRAGDSLTEIAQHYRVSLQALAGVNGLDWRKRLLIGVVLRVPSSGSATSGWEGIYVVHAGDTLSGIALRFHVSLVQLASANRIDPSGVLLTGVRLRVPTSGNSTVDLAHVVQRDQYRRGAVGFDMSYPNCAGSVPASHAFAVIGLNRGRPFTTNPCFASEWAAAEPPRSVYINTAYSRTLFRLGLGTEIARALAADPPNRGRRQQLRGKRSFRLYPDRPPDRRALWHHPGDRRQRAL